MPTHASVSWKTRQHLLVFAAVIFAVSAGVRLLSWQDTAFEVWKIQTVVAGDYRRDARAYLAGGLRSFLNPSATLRNPNTLGHPPGYSILMAIVFKFFGESDSAIQFFQIASDALAAVIIFLIAAELVNMSAAVFAGIMAGLSPQLAWNSVLLLPDSLAVLPILLAVYCMVLGRKHPGLMIFLLAGFFVGLSCWLRANAMLLTFFLASVVLFLCERGKRVRYALTIVGGTILAIAPLTIRNAIVFRHFIPVSLGAGQTLLTGIAEYDKENKFGLPLTDIGLLKQEAEIYNRPDYYHSYFNPDGLERERMRLERGFAIVRSNPVWFLEVMIKRGSSMLRLERARLISNEPALNHSLELTKALHPVWINSPEQFLANGDRSLRADVSLAPNTQYLRLAGDESKYGKQLASAPFMIEKDMDYVLSFPVKIERGRMNLSLESADQKKTYTSIIVESLEATTPEQQPENLIQLYFISPAKTDAQLVISNAASKPDRPIIKLGSAKLYSLGPATQLWTRYPRWIVGNVQRVFLTAFMLPLAILGMATLAYKRKGHALTLLLIVPLYYLCIQSAVHTEYRYVLAVPYFLFALAAVTLSVAGKLVGRNLQRFWSSIDSRLSFKSTRKK